MSKKIDEIQELCDAQIAQIFSLRQEIEKYKKEIQSLKETLYNSSPLISKDTKITDEEFIALNELKKLKFKSEHEDLTYEDAKRVELFFKVLHSIRNPKEEKAKEPLKEVSTEELLSQLTEN